MKIPNATQGGITLSKIEYAPRRSRETLAFTANIEVNGLKGTVSNDGWGGSNFISPREVAEAVEAYAKSLPPCPVEWLTKALPYSADMLVSEMLGKAVEAHETAKEQAKMVKKGYTHYTVVGKRAVYSKGVPGTDYLTRTFGAAASSARITRIA